MRVSATLVLAVAVVGGVLAVYASRLLIAQPARNDADACGSAEPRAVDAAIKDAYDGLFAHRERECKGDATQIRGPERTAFMMQTFFPLCARLCQACDDNERFYGFCCACTQERMLWGLEPAEGDKRRDARCAYDIMCIQINMFNNRYDAGKPLEGIASAGQAHLLRHYGFPLCRQSCAPDENGEQVNDYFCVSCREDAKRYWMKH